MANSAVGHSDHHGHQQGFFAAPPDQQGGKLFSSHTARQVFGLQIVLQDAGKGLQGCVANVDASQMCYACFNNDYPTEIECEAEIATQKFIFEQKRR